MPEQKRHPEDAPVREPNLVSARRDEGDGAARVLPALELVAIELGSLLPVAEVLARIAAREPVVDRRKVENAKVDAVVAEPVHPADRVGELRGGPRRLAELVGVVVEEPVGAELLREFLFSPEDRRPVERVRLPFRKFCGELLDVEKAL